MDLSSTVVFGAAYGFYLLPMARGAVHPLKNGWPWGGLQNDLL